MANFFIYRINAKNASKTYIMKVNAHSDTYWYSFILASKLFTNLVRTYKISIFHLQKQGLKILKIVPKDFKIT